MVKAFKTLQIFYPRILHVTCVLHSLNRAAEKVREICPAIRVLVNSRKKAFLIDREIMDVPLPPEPILTS